MAFFRNDSDTRLLLDKRPNVNSRYSCDAKGTVDRRGNPMDIIDIDDGDEKLPGIAASIADKDLVPCDGKVMKKKEEVKVVEPVKVEADKKTKEAVVHSDKANKNKKK